LFKDGRIPKQYLKKLRKLKSNLDGVLVCAGATWRVTPREIGARGAVAGPQNWPLRVRR